MASEGVKLVERLRLGDPPAPVDWALAAAIWATRDAARRFGAAGQDLVEDRDRYSNKARFVVRASLVAQSLRDLADCAAVLQRRLEAYFAYRTAEEESDPPSQEAQAGSSGSGEGPESEVGKALEAGGVAAEVAGVLGDALEQVRLECAWLEGALEHILDSRPDEDEVLDFLSELEARFEEDLFSVESRGRKQYVSGAVEDAIAKAR